MVSLDCTEALVSISLAIAGVSILSFRIDVTWWLKLALLHTALGAYTFSGEATPTEYWTYFWTLLTMFIQVLGYQGQTPRILSN